MGHVAQEGGFRPAGGLCHLQGVFELFPQFSFLLFLFFDGLRIFLQFPVDSRQFPVAVPITEQRRGQGDQNRNGKDDGNDVFPQKIHYGIGMHPPDKGI